MKISNKYNLLIKNPELCKEWSSKNKLGAENYMPNCHEKVSWICKKCNEDWKATISSRNNGNGCPYCAGKHTTKENNLLAKNPKLCKEWSNKNKLSADNYMPNSNQSVIWICKKCNHEWKALISNRNRGRGCPNCCGRVLTNENNLLAKNPELCEEWSSKNENTADGYMPNSNKLALWICKKCNNEWEAMICDRNKGVGCPNCPKSVSKSSQQWLDKLNIKIREFKIPFTNYVADGYDPETNIIYEFNGDLYHSNPKIYNLNDKHPIRKGQTHKEIYEKTKKRERVLKYLGYKLITIWESDWKSINLPL